MFVSETNIFDHGNIKIKVSSMDGVNVLLEVNPEITVDHLKIQISSHLYDPVESVKTSLYHRLLHVRSGCVLDEDNTLARCGIEDHDELLLVKKRVPGPSLEGAQSKIREDSKKTPSAEDIKQVTLELTSVNSDRKPADSVPSASFKEELRKILVSLIDAAQKILCLNPEAAKMFEEAEKCIIEERSQTSVSTVDVDEAALEQLTAMGFPENRVRKALILNTMSAVDAIQWILEHEADPDIDAPLQSKTPSHASCLVNTTVTRSADGLSQSDSCTVTQANGATALGFQNSTAQHQPVNKALQLAQMSGPQKVKKMLKGFRAYRRREFRANAKALKTLVEMGFDEADALDALSIHGNKQEEACDWLLSGGHLQQVEDNLEEGLAADSAVYKAIMASPVVQIGLNNPKSLLAFLMILENPNNTQQWLNDADIGPMLIQLSRIYHAEKHTKN